MVNESRLQQVTVSWEGDRLQFGGAAMSAPSDPCTATSLNAYIDEHPKFWPLNDSFFPSDPKLVIQSIHSGSGVIIADGSYKPRTSKRLGASAWRFECGTTGASCTGTCQTSGTCKEVNSYHLELQGEHAGLLGMLAFCTFHDVRNGSIWVGCDNKVGIRQASGTAQNISLSWKHVDIIRAICIMVAEFRKCNIKVTFFDIDGHQDDHRSFASLDRPSQLNVLMDEAAKARLDQLIAARAP